ncbi:MAG: CHAT domain-containing protein [Microscillaceae bacterium]|nr:CHAT domain-containing protein [Microscillaceae bacterium]
MVLTGVSTYAKSKEKYQTEDGFLTAYEAQNLNLDNTDLVVLSACQTGQGDVQNGEGVYLLGSFCDGWGVRCRVRGVRGREES